MAWHLVKHKDNFNLTSILFSSIAVNIAPPFQPAKDQDKQNNNSSWCSVWDWNIDFYFEESTQITRVQDKVTAKIFVPEKDEIRPDFYTKRDFVIYIGNAAGS